MGLLFLENFAFCGDAPLHPGAELLAHLAVDDLGHLAPVLLHAGLEGADIDVNSISPKFHNKQEQT